jgi:hypothetical protein
LGSFTLDGTLSGLSCLHLFGFFFWLFLSLNRLGCLHLFGFFFWLFLPLNRLIPWPAW